MHFANIHTQYNTIDSRNCWPTQCKPAVEKKNEEGIPKCKLKTTRHLCNTVLLQSSIFSSHANAKSPEVLISLSMDGGFDCLRVVKSFICVKMLAWPTLLACSSQVWVERWQSRQIRESCQVFILHCSKPCNMHIMVSSHTSAPQPRFFPLFRIMIFANLPISYFVTL